MKINIKYICLLILILSLIFTNIVKSNEDDDDNGGDDDDDSEISKDVIKRNLVRENITPSQILNNHNKCYKNNKIKKFKGNSLAYITPWNGKGYDIAKKYANKFSHISPVWFQIKFEKGNYIIEGDHNIDSKWVSTIKTNSNDNTKIIPRFSFEGNQPWTKQSFSKVFSDGSKFQTDLISILNENKFDGLVFEGIVSVPRDIRDSFLIKFAEKLHLINKEIFLVVSPIRQKGQDTGFGENDFDKLSKHLDGFSLMTYDYSPSHGMNSPLPWCKDNLIQLLSNTPENSKKLYMGIPFYGYKSTLDGQTSPEAVVGSQFIDILKENKNKKFKWTEQTGEHVILDKNGVSIVYPSLLFLNEHLQLAKQYKASISIWEIGQGLDYFTDLL